MSFDLAVALVLLTAASGLIWLYDLWRLAPLRAMRLSVIPENAKEEERKAAARIPVIVDLARSLFPVFLIVLLLRSFLVEPFRIPSQSMMPTLLVGDFILVNKYLYGLRLPVLNTKIFPISEPQRGDIVVFRYPENPSIPFIKRVVGLPGDHIAYHSGNKTLYINGELVSQEIISTFQGVGAGSNMTGTEHRLELLPGHAHDILINPNRFSPIPFQQAIIPDGQYFVMGDNRDNSHDSRYWGTVPEENLIGKAFMIWMNFDLANGGIDWRRLGAMIL